MAHRHMKKCSISLIIWEVQFQTRMGIITPTRMALIKMTKSGAGSDMEKQKPSTLLVENRLVLPLWKSLALKKKS